MLKLIATIAILAAVSISAAAEEKSPNWSKTIRMTDGRTFVTDGAFMIDAGVAGVTDLPKTELPEATAKLIERYMSAPHTSEAYVSELVLGSDPRMYRAPSGLFLNADYVSFIRRKLPQAKFRMKGELDPVAILSNGKAVGVVMPMKGPKP